MQSIQADELIKKIKSGLLSWYEFIPNASVLYIGNEGDEYHTYLMEQDVTVMVKDISRLHILSPEEKENYDYIVCIELWEQLESPCQFFSSCSHLLNSRGILLLGMNNRYGLRYFCGDRDPYTRRVFDGVEGYKRVYTRKDEAFAGRCYSKSEISNLIEHAGFLKSCFFSVLPDLSNPSMIFSEHYLPNEDMSNRLFPTYNYPSSVFMEEECLYEGIIENGMFHSMANAYLIESTKEGVLSDILHVTNSAERGCEDALLTIVRDNKTVEKKPTHSLAQNKLQHLMDHARDLSAHGIKMVEASYESGRYIMPYMDYEVGQVYLKRLLREDKDKFLLILDHFCELILQSSEIVSPDIGDGKGATLRKGYLDMVPLNSFFVNDEFVFFDQEFCEDNYPANVLIWRVLGTFYAGDVEVEKLLPQEELIERYHLKPYLGTWQEMEWAFLRKLRKEDELREYHALHRRNRDVMKENRERMNFSKRQFDQLFVNVLDNADTKKLILFGSGAYTKDFLSLYRFDYPVYAIIDNNAEKWGQELSGIPIRSPECLKELPRDSYKVIICVKDYLPIMIQLDALGVQDYSIYEKGKEYPRKYCIPGNRSLNEEAKPKKYHIGYVAGAFDMFHIGHVNLLRKAKEQCDYLIVGVLSDQGIFNLKQKYPIIPVEDRIAVIQACKYADLVEELPVDRMSIRDAYATYHFDVQFSGNDHANDPGWLMEQAYLRERGSDIVFFDYTQKVSSSMLREKIKEN